MPFVKAAEPLKTTPQPVTRFISPHDEAYALRRQRSSAAKMRPAAKLLVSLGQPGLLLEASESLLDLDGPKECPASFR
jgi:hypothetical protein